MGQAAYAQETESSGPGECLRFRIYFISCTVTSAFYSPCGLGEIVCLHFLTDSWARRYLDISWSCFMCHCHGLNSAGAGSPRLCLGTSSCSVLFCWGLLVSCTAPDMPWGPSPACRAALPEAFTPQWQGMVPEVISVTGSRCNRAAPGLQLWWKACDCHTVSLRLWGTLPWHGATKQEWEGNRTVYSDRTTQQEALCAFSLLQAHLKQNVCIFQM